MSSYRHVVLLVEDECMVRTLLCEQLEEEGYEVVDCASGDEACEYLRDGGRCDFLLTDVRMPGSCDGLQLADWVEANRPHAPIIIMSSHLTPEQIRGREFISKPYQSNTLISKLADMLGGSGASG
jgi:CheY-like chemotaxis protein